MSELEKAVLDKGMSGINHATSRGQVRKFDEEKMTQSLT